MMVIFLFVLQYINIAIRCLVLLLFSMAYGGHSEKSATDVSCTGQVGENKGFDINYMQSFYYKICYINFEITYFYTSFILYMCTCF